MRNSHSGARGPASRRGAGAGACTQEAFPSSSQGQHREIGVLHGCQPADLSLRGVVQTSTPAPEARLGGAPKPPIPSLPDLQGGQKQPYAADPRERQSLVRSQGPHIPVAHPVSPLQSPLFLWSRPQDNWGKPVPWMREGGGVAAPSPSVPWWQGRWSATQRRGRTPPRSHSTSGDPNGLVTHVHRLRTA